ncbi:MULTISPECIES: hypothetical protein [Bradyrhizobium]|uniref:hypothetical protein n=1 Tax=Bradyrhizobium TaxID=374 RepID=UPI001FCD9C67|nr:MULTISPECIES: hypothetical protein [Bradyrhizobium]
MAPLIRDPALTTAELIKPPVIRELVRKLFRVPPVIVTPPLMLENALLSKVPAVLDKPPCKRPPLLTVPELVTRPETTPLKLLKVPPVPLLNVPVTDELLSKVPPEVMLTFDVSETKLATTSLPADIDVLVKLLSPDNVKVLAAACDKVVPDILLAMLIAWPALALLVKVAALLKLTSNPVRV